MKVNVLKLLLFTGLFFGYSCSMTPETKKIKYGYKIKKEYNLKLDNRIAKPYKEEWWKKFNDERLNKIVEKTINNNFDLKMALTNINILRIQYNLSEIKKFPILNLTFGASKTKMPVMGFSINRSNGTMTKTYESQVKNNYNLKFGAMFELDLFDKYGALSRSALNNLKVSEANYRKLYFSLISKVVSLYFDIILLKKSVKLTQEAIKIYTTELSLQKEKYGAGLESIYNINSLEQNIYNLRINLEDLNKQVKLRKYMLFVLAGEYPDDELTVSEDLNLLEKLEDVSLGIPSELLKNRFDIIAAKYNLDSARELIGYRKADRFPSVSLSAVAGFLNLTELGNFFDSEFITLSSGVDVNYTVFSYSGKKNSCKQAIKQYNLALLKYKNIVLNAFKEVEEILIKIKTLKKQLEYTEKLIEITSSSYNDAKMKYEGGSGSYKMLSDLLKAKINLKLNKIKLEKVLIFSYLDLYRALGKK